jgi:hypothetical protein
MIRSPLGHVVRNAREGRDVLISTYRADVGRYLTNHWHEVGDLKVVEVREAPTGETYQRVFTARDWFAGRTG